jgi:hypothetical protein
MINKPTHEVQLVFFGTTGAESNMCISRSSACAQCDLPSSCRVLFLQTRATCSIRRWRTRGTTHRCTVRQNPAMHVLICLTGMPAGLHTTKCVGVADGRLVSLTRAAAVHLQYQHIREERDLAPPDVGWLRSLAGVQHGSPDVQPDWFSALTVGCRRAVS